MSLLKTKVNIDGITIRDDSDSNALSYLINWEYERTGTNQVSELDVTVLKSITNDVTLSTGKTLEIWMGFNTSTDEKIFDGYISEYSPEGGVINITAKDKLWDLVRKNVNKVYESSGPQGGQISAIAKDLIETYGGLNSSVVVTGTAATEIINEFRCVYTDIFERLKALADAVRYQFWYDANNDIVHFEPKGYHNSGLTLTVGTEIIGVPKWTEDTSKMVNDLRVDGAVSLTQIRKPLGTGYGTIGTTPDFNTDGIVLDKTPESVELIMDSNTPPVTVKTGGSKDASSGHFYYVDKENKKVVPTTGTTFPLENAIVNYTWYAPSPIHQINAESITTYGKFEKQMTISDIKSIADAEVRTADVLAKFSQPFLIGDLLVRSSPSININIGDTIRIVDSVNSPNIDKELVITKQVLKYPASNQEITVGDEPLRLADWQVDVESRLKRIEESLSLSNQDLILELVDIQDSSILQPRYMEIQQRNIAGDSMIWGSTEFGVWGDAKWGSVTTTSFILGKPTSAILGTSKLGSQTSEPKTFWIGQYQDTYIEDFRDEDFKGENITGVWDTVNRRLIL